MTIRQFCTVSVSLFIILSFSDFVFGQTYPNRIIRIATAEAGGGADFASRILAQALPASVGWQVIVENRAGAGVASEYVSKAAPDGYTLLLNGSTIWLGPLLQDGFRYDPVRDFAPVSVVSKAHNILVVHPAVPARTARELIALARGRPGEIDYASANLGSTSHLSAELFKSMAGVNMRRIPYKGTGGALNAVIAGQVQVMFSSASSVGQFVRSGKLRGLAITSEQTSELFPDLQPLAATLPGYEASQIYGVFAPARIPAGVLSRLNQEIVRVLNTSEVKERFLKVGIEAVGSTPEQFATAIKSDMTRMGKLIREGGIREEP